MTSLEQELKIPSDATLDVSEVASLTSKSETGTIAIAIAIGPSTRAHEKDRRFLVVGRQAAVADLRIDHKSISRKHAVLYYSGDNDSHSHSHNHSLLLCDLGTKKGTKVNGVALQRPTPLNPNDTVQFGVAHPIFTIQWNRRKDSTANDPAQQQEATLEEEETIPPEEQAATATATAIVEPQDPPEEKEEEEEQEIPEPGAGLTGRAKRQAEIAAMMASLEAQPTYEKFVPSTTEPEPLTTEDKCFQKPQEPQQQQQQDYDTSMAQKYKLPLSDSLQIEHASTISCIAMDPTGARFAVASSDTNVRIYDFAGMNALKPLPFGTFTVQDGYPIQALCYSPNGDRLLVATGSAQPKVLNRDGQELVQLVRGDVYVTDPTKTIGHTATVTCVAWHPLEKDIVITGSRDGSVRWWDLKKGKRQFSMLTCSNIVAIKSGKGRKTAVTSLAFSPGGREVAVGTLCGSIQLWNPTQSKLRPQRAVYPTTTTAPIYSLVFSVDGSRLASRSTQACSVWNPAKLSKSSSPVVDYQGVELDDTSTMETSTIAFSPNGKVLCVPCCPDPKQPCILKFFAVAPDKTTPLLEYPLSSSVVGMAAVQWHAKLNQLLVASSQHDGLQLQVLYASQHSKKGALLTAGIQRHKRAEDDLQQLYDSRAPKGTPVSYGEILTPNALPLFQPEGHASKKGKRKQLDDATAASRHPEPPRKGFRATTQGGVGSTFTQFIVDSTQGKTKSMAGKDPREALFQYQKGKSFISSAYKGNKEHVMAEKTMEQEEDELNEENKKK
jgi:WD40 repeat protein/pSer/pThr/pTyr-binding forkhead associated (FHA) protein